MATQAFKVNFTSYTNPVIMVWYKHSAPLAEKGRVLLPFPNVSGEVVEATGLTAETYIFRFFESPDSVTLSTLIESWSVDVAKGTKTRTQKYFYTVGGPDEHDPAPNQDTLTDERLAGADAVYVWNRGTSFRKPSDFELLEEGGFKLLWGELFSEFDEWMVEVVNNDDATTTDVTGVFSDINIVSVSAGYDDNYKNTHNVAAFPADSTGITTFPAFSTLPEQKATFSTFATTARYWRLQFAPGDTVLFLGVAVNQITLRRNEKIELIIKAGACYVIDYEGGAELAGEYLFADKKLINTEFADGSEKNIADYQDLINRLPAEKVVSYADWDLFTDVQVGIFVKRYYRNRGKFAVDAVSGKFKFPDIRGFSLRALHSISGANDITMIAQGVGGMWAQEIVQHGHAIRTTFGQPSGNQFGSPIRGTQQGSVNDEGEVGPDNTISLEGGYEQRIDSVGVLPLVRI